MAGSRAYTEISYTSKAWLKRRAKQLKEFPWCKYCQLNNMRSKATHVDHIKPHRGDPKLFDDDTNLQSLCAICANTVKQAEEVLGEEIGCDLSGFPRGANHPWRGGSIERPANTSIKIGRELRDRKRSD